MPSLYVYPSPTPILLHSSNITILNISGKYHPATMSSLNCTPDATCVALIDPGCPSQDN